MSNANNSPGSRGAGLATVQELAGSGPRGGLRNDHNQTAAAIINHYMSGGKDVLGGGGPGLDYLMSGGGDDASNRYASINLHVGPNWSTSWVKSSNMKLRRLFSLSQLLLKNSILVQQWR